MVRINLLPWREERRKHRQKEFLILLGASAIAAVLLSFLIVAYYNAQISGQNERNGYLQTQIDSVKKQIEEIKLLDEQKARLLSRKQIIEELQADRSQMVHLFDSLVRTIPDGVVLTSIKQSGDQLSLAGIAQSNTRVSTYLSNLESSGWMRSPDLAKIQAIPEPADPNLSFAFELSVVTGNPNKVRDTDGDGVPDAPAEPVPGTDPAATGTTPAAAPAPAGTAPAQPAAAPAAAPTTSGGSTP